MIPQKKYHYKVYRSGTYLGLLRDVKSEFTFTQDINSAGSTLEVKVPFNMDNINQAVEALLTEDGNPILDESDNPILVERATDEFGNADDYTKIRTGNTVDVYEYSERYPNGKIMFSGIINRIEGSLNDDASNDLAVITVYSHGYDLDNYIIQDGS